MQKALDSVTEWPRQNYVEIAVEMTAAMVISLDPRETTGKSTPNLEMLSETVPYEKKTKISGWKLTASYDSDHQTEPFSRSNRTSRNVQQSSSKSNIRCPQRITCNSNMRGTRVENPHTRPRRQSCQAP